MGAQTHVFRAGGTALLRACACPALTLPPWPDLIGTVSQQALLTSQVAWLRAVLGADAVREGLEHASPVLAARVHELCEAKDRAAHDVQRAVRSVARYVLRAESRATPFGLFAGVTTASFGVQARADWGTGHRAFVGPSAEWLAVVTAQLQNCPELLGRLLVVTNSSLMIRGGRLIVPYQANVQGESPGAVEISLRHTAPVRMALATARTPIRLEELGGKILADFPAAEPEKVTALLAELVAKRALITCLHAPSTETDPLRYLLGQLEATDAAAVSPVAELVLALHEIQAQLTACCAPPVGEARGARENVAARMRDLVPAGRRHPLAIDLRLDGTVALPSDVARDIERAALVLARVSAAPHGASAWKAYHQRFYERFGIGSMVPVLDVVADSGIGFPDGYPGSATAERRPPVSGRDEALVGLAQKAALDGRDEVVLNEKLITSLNLGPDPARLPPHLEVGVRVHAASVMDLDRGRFRLEIVSVSRGAGVGIGRFLSILEPRDHAALAAELADLPSADDATVPAQLSFPPWAAESSHVTRSPQVLPLLISLEEHRTPSDHVLTVEDLAVGCDGHRMYLAAPARGHRVEALGMHALNLHKHTPPLARFLIELSRAQCAVVTLFDWGAARTLPFLPRLRYDRTVLSPARWRFEAAEFPSMSQSWPAWDETLTKWRAMRRLPARVYLTEGDRLLALDLDQPGHRVLLRVHMNRAGQAVLTEAPQDFGWCGGRAHEVVIPLKAAGSPRWPRLPEPSPARIIGRDHGQAPANSPVLLASLYGDIGRQDAILAGYLPELLDRLGQPPWWYVRFRDPDQHLRLRIALRDPGEFGQVARTVSIWSDELHHAGLVREVRYPTSYPESGRWGSGAAWASAEEVFRADSRAVLTQLRQPIRPQRRALVAAHATAIVSAFQGSTAAGTRWLISHVARTAPEPIPRSLFNEAVRIADPGRNWTALRRIDGGAAIVAAWAERDQALAAYRRHLPGPDTCGIDADDVLGSLLHVHFVRAVAVDFTEEAICLYLARAAALAWTARSAKSPE